MSIHSVYIYPNISRDMMGSNNPYIDQLKQALKDNGLEVDPSTSRNAFMDFLRKGMSADMVILNWLENLPSRRFGILQTVILLTYIRLLKIRGTKIIWIKHNKVSHIKKWFAISKKIQQVLARCADYIIIHALDAGDTNPQKTIFFPHPAGITPDKILNPREQQALPDIDLLVWGSLYPYKGVLEFLRYAKTDPALAGRNIYIAGKSGADYWQQLQQQAGSNTTLVNAFIDEPTLIQLFKRSRFILFTYKKDSVISSGVLMDSLAACKRIIAPDCGAFRDLAQQQQFVSLFEDFSSIASICSLYDNDNQLNYQEVQKFVAQNSWYSMGTKIKGLFGLNSGARLLKQIKIPELP